MMWVTNWGSERLLVRTYDEPHLVEDVFDPGYESRLIDATRAKLPRSQQLPLDLGEGEKRVHIRCHEPGEPVTDFYRKHFTCMLSAHEHPCPPGAVHDIAILQLGIADPSRGGVPKEIPPAA